jgi:hypothetical protein
MCSSLCFQPEYFCCAKFVRLGYLVWLGEMPASPNRKHWRRGNDQREDVMGPQPRRIPITARCASSRALCSWDPRAVAHRFLRLRELVSGVVDFAISPSLLVVRCNVAWRINIWRPSRQLLTAPSPIIALGPGTASPFAQISPLSGGHFLFVVHDFRVTSLASHLLRPAMPDKSALPRFATSATSSCEA